MRSAVRKLCQQGVEALRPQKVNEKWRKPAISRRVAGDLRKAAIRAGTYGKFDAETGAGWDPAWDAPDRRHPLLDAVAAVDDTESVDSILLGTNKGAIQSIRPPKETKRERTRETRAQKIENLLKEADEKIEEYRLEKEANKPKPGIEEEFKQAMKGSRY
uniref:Large ribosomal subunit protein mL59 domain-containing protein n=1 Tax=Skeletonema marinoi TaxID=267567 RepID=A0A7S0TGG1_9STRA|mmetsp:Transcript_830/g.1591  ORF Transcript_830/g.1591 Transcript_830/m.1591 type:complete len:160 (+) Transcript_830:59-538(+)